MEKLSKEEVKRQQEAEVIAAVLRNATIAFLDATQNAGVDISHLTIHWNYDDGKHIIEGGV